MTLPLALDAPEAAPTTEYLRGAVIDCGCPRHVVGLNDLRPLVVLAHRADCGVRHPQYQVAEPPEPRVPPGVHPCPACGNVAFSLVEGGRRCEGPVGRACGRTWSPKPVVLTGKEG